jgi:hypothetical protein
MTELMVGIDSFGIGGCDPVLDAGWGESAAAILLLSVVIRTGGVGVDQEDISRTTSVEPANHRVDILRVVATGGGITGLT